MLEALGGRKFLLTIIIIAVGSAVHVLSPKGMSTELTALLIGAMTAYGASNAFVTSSAISAGLGEGAPAPEQQQPVAPPPPLDIEPWQTAVAETINSLQASVGSHSQAIAGLQQNALNTQKLVQAALQIKS